MKRILSLLCLFCSMSSLHSKIALSDHISFLDIEESLSSILLDLAAVEKKIYDSIDLRNMIKVGATNATGDVQCFLDTLADKMIAQALNKNIYVCAHLSEEFDEPRFCPANGQYFVAYDPYDGGSVGDANVSVGSIFGIWNKPPALGKSVGRHLISGAYALWGPSLIFAFATQEHGAFWYEHDGQDYYLIDQLNCDKAGMHAGVFCPGDSPTLLESNSYEALFKYALTLKYRLRYTGCCVTDTHHVLHKKGLFWYPKGKKGGLRLLYECAPLGFIIKIAGGIAIAHDGQDIMDIPIEHWHQRSGFLFASPDHAQEAKQLFVGL